MAGLIFSSNLLPAFCNIKESNQEPDSQRGLPMTTETGDTNFPGTSPHPHSSFPIWCPHREALENMHRIQEAERTSWPEKMLKRSRIQIARISQTCLTLRSGAAFMQQTASHNAQESMFWHLLCQSIKWKCKQPWEVGGEWVGRWGGEV